MRPVRRQHWQNSQILSWREIPQVRQGLVRRVGTVRAVLQFPPAARKVSYTTNSIESFNNGLRKATRNRVQFTNDESALKTLWLMICNIEDERSAKRAKEGRRVAASAGRLVEGGKVSGWK